MNTKDNFDISEEEWKRMEKETDEEVKAMRAVIGNKNDTSFKRSFKEGVKSSKPKSGTQGIVVGLLLGVITAISFFNPLPIFLKVFIFLILLFILGLFASSKKWKDKI